MNKIQYLVTGATLSACAAGGFGVGSMLGAIGDGIAGEKTEVATVEAEVQAYKSKLTEFTAYDDTLIRYGQTCLSVLENYQQEGPLAATPVDSAINDLMTSPDKPCGDDPTQARITFQDVKGVKDTLFELQAQDINQKYRKIDSIKENNRIDDEYALWWRVGLVFAALGSIIGIPAGIALSGDFFTENTSKNKRRK